MALAASQGKASFCCTRPILWLLTFTIFSSLIQGVLKPRVPISLSFDSLQHPSSRELHPWVQDESEVPGEQQQCSLSDLCQLRCSLWIFTEGIIS